MATVTLRTPAGDVHVVDAAVAAYYEGQGWVREASPAELEQAVEEAHELKGAALDDALKDAGISHSGLTADEKRAALADHRSSTPTEE